MELAKRVKQQLLKDGDEKIETAVLVQWEKLFTALQQTKAQAEAAVV